MPKISLHSSYPGKEPVEFNNEELSRYEKLFLVANLVVESNYPDEQTEVSPSVQDITLRIIDDMTLKDIVETAATVLNTVETRTDQIEE